MFPTSVALIFPVRLVLCVIAAAAFVTLVSFDFVSQVYLLNMPATLAAVRRTQLNRLSFEKVALAFSRGANGADPAAFSIRTSVLSQCTSIRLTQSSIWCVLNSTHAGRAGHSSTALDLLWKVDPYFFTLLDVQSVSGVDVLCVVNVGGAVVVYQCGATSRCTQVLTLNATLAATCVISPTGRVFVASNRGTMFADMRGGSSGTWTSMSSRTVIAATNDTAFTTQDTFPDQVVATSALGSRTLLCPSGARPRFVTIATRARVQAVGTDTVFWCQETQTVWSQPIVAGSPVHVMTCRNASKDYTTSVCVISSSGAVSLHLFSYAGSILISSDLSVSTTGSESIDLTLFDAAPDSGYTGAFAIDNVIRYFTAADHFRVAGSPLPAVPGFVWPDSAP